MAEVTRSAAKPATVKVTTAVKALPPTLTLPMTPSQPSKNINDYHFLIHGEPKIGKTSLTTQEGRVFAMEFDPFQKAASILQRHIPDWRSFDGYLQLLEQAKKDNRYPYTRVVIDNTAIWYGRCQEWAEKKLVVDHISEPKWGLGWDKLKYNFSAAVDRLMALPGGCWFICHSEWAEVESRNGGKITKLIPEMKGGAAGIITGRCDGTFAYTYVGSERILIIEGDERTGAGHRIEGHFLTPSGQKVREIPMGHSAKEAWANLVNCFNNKQTFVSIKDRDRQKGAK